MGITIGSKTLKRIVIGFAAAVLSLGVATAVEAVTTTKTSSGVKCTIIGTAASNTITGTAAKDVICGLGGNDTIKGLGGDDIIDGGTGNDVINAGDGNDTVIGGIGDDKLRGDGGNDSFYGDDGNDALTGGEGNDTLRGGNGNDAVTGDAGNDTAVGGVGNDSINGGLGDDKISGEGGNDSIYGGDGVDTLSGNDGVDAVTGDAGNDKLTGGAGDDNLAGGAGDDNLAGEIGNDTANGGDGADALLGGDGNDTLTGGIGDDTVGGDGGNDKLVGGDGTDTLSGSSGDDTIAGDGGNDTVVGGDGNDTLNGGVGNDTVGGDGGNDAVVGGDGNDTLNGGIGNDTVGGDGGNDAIVGGDGNDALNGGDGNDKLTGDAGNDTMKGEAGNDGMIGGAGSDNLAGANGVPAPTERNLCEKDAADTVTYCGFDDAAPWIVSAELEKTSVDSSATSQTIKVTLQVTDELMGVDTVGCSVMFDGARSATGYDRAVRSSGDAVDGIYTCNVTIPFGGSTGRWGLNLDTRDRAGNMGFGNQGPNGKWHSNLPEIMAQTPSHWIEQTGAGDNQSPRITNPVFSKTEIDTSAGTDSFNLDMTITDDFSGVDTVQCGPRHNAVENFDIKIVVTKVSGTDTDGVWRCAVTLPKNSGKGKWYLAVFVSDKSGKRYSIDGKPTTETTWSVDDVNELFMQPPLDLGVNFITQVGDGDDELPTMTSISLDKTQVNTSSSDQTVVATLNLVDVQSGIRSAELRSFSPTTFAQNTSACKMSTTDGAGNEVWTCTLKLPLGSQKGLHGFSIMMFDKVGNRVTYDMNKDTGKWRMVPLSFYGYDATNNLDLGPVGVLNTD
ncbi:MAG: hypothetical protein RIS55_297 [Actinomycetota bacterium]|jgi:Ca2+-binding RTX toxin-like protein